MAKLTEQQRLAVENRGGKLLVSAAAGSGKTKVLVDRLMLYIMDPADPANIDDFLIITYTKAAASELRTKIANKLSELIAENPENRHLQQQMQRLYLAKISTVHGFCTDILRQYAYRLDITGDFRVADENECMDLKLRALERTLELAYETAENNPAFCAFVDTQGLGRDDREIPEIILKVYDSARCHLDPHAWLDWCANGGVGSATGVEETSWGAYLIQDLKEYLSRQITAFNNCIAAAEKAEGMEKPVALLSSTVAQLQQLYDCQTWDEIIDHKKIEYGSLSFPKNCTDLQLIEQIKAIRNACKKGMETHLSSFANKSSQVLADISRSADAARGLVELVLSFEKNYAAMKKNRGIVDFGDLEHCTLELLWGKDRKNPTAIAAEAGNGFREVLVDEYQDSNAIQDAIFSALTLKKQNCFMVGDVKQSIYQFRLAEPGIFIEKYNTYLSAEKAQAGEGRRVLLNHNFRSSGGVIEAVNHVFTQCMSTKVGGLDYGEAELLREGIPHIPMKETEVSFFAIETEQDSLEEEASFVADKICGMLDGTHYVRDGESLRPVKPDDIVILLHSPSVVGSEYQYALQSRGIRCFTGDRENFLQAEEITTIRAFLEIINNPLQDIPLAAVLTSPVFGFTADDLAKLRAGKRYEALYDVVAASSEEKCCHFVNTLNTLRQQSRLFGITELLSEIYSKTNLLSIFSAMTEGEARLENLQTFFQTASGFETSGPKELSLFLEHLTALENKGVGGEQQKPPATVSILSIHKSKGLEFPVVFLCNLGTGFNMRDANKQVLCDKDLGLGLGCADAELRIRYPSVAKKAIRKKMYRERVSEELRVLYVAMTRPKDRLVMTYADKTLPKTLQDIAMRMDLTGMKELAAEAGCLGDWVLQAALTRTEAGELFALGGNINCSEVKKIPWEISVVRAGECVHLAASDEIEEKQAASVDVERLASALSLQYGYTDATRIPSKLTATQLKGRLLDSEVTDGSGVALPMTFRHAGKTEKTGKIYGNAIHAVLQHIDFEKCETEQNVCAELDRMVKEQFISPEQARMVDCSKITAFFGTPLGKRLRQGGQVLREFKFSILEDASKFYPNTKEEKILFQGIVDCALIEDDGITVIDFKSDYITDKNLTEVSERYAAQVRSYAGALSRIFEKPVKEAKLYFFSIDQFVDVVI